MDENKKIECELCHTKNTPRSEEMQHLLEVRLNIIIGQMNGIKKMIDENRYCGDILTQVASAESALQSLGYIVLQNHMETCVTEKLKAGDSDIMNETIGLIKKLK